MIKHRVALLALVSLTALSLGAGASAATAAPQKAPKAGTCFGKSPTVVLMAKGQKRVLTKTTKNAVVDLLGKGESLDAGKAKGNTYVCDTGGAKSIVTGDGNDKVTVRDGSPTVSTGKGNDLFTQTGTGNPVVHLGAGVDSAALSRGNGVVYGDDGNDTLRVGSKGRQKEYGGKGHDTLVAGPATSTLDGQDGGTAYLVAGAFVKNTTVVLHPGDTVNGKTPTAPAPAPMPVVPAPAPTPAPPAPPLPSGTVVAFGDAAASNVGKAGNKLLFNLTGAPGSGRTLATWSLDVGDGSAVRTGIGAPPSAVAHAYAAAGSYTARLTLTDDLGRSVVTPAAIDIAGVGAVKVAVTSATGTPAHQTAPAVTISVQSSPGQRAAFIMSSVDFGDGYVPTVTGGPAAGSLSHSYSAPGSYSVTVIETDDHGGSSSAYTTVNIVDSAVHAVLLDDTDFPLSQVLAPAGGYASIDASRSVGTGTGALTALSFDPGNGSSVKNLLTNPYTSVSYKAGSYTATLSATSGGSTVTSSYPVYVAGASSGSIVGPSDPATAVAGTPVTFTATTSLGAAPAKGPANKAVKQLVDFGDGTDLGGLSGTTITHTYAQPGVYTVFYELTDAYGGPQSATGLYVTVTRSTPYLMFSADATYPQGSPWAGTSVTSDPASPRTYGDLEGLGSTGHLTGALYRIDWGDGSTPDSGMADTSGAVHPIDITHAYAKPGEFTATASITDSANLTTTVSQHVSVSAAPTLTLGTPTVSGGVLTQPVTSTSSGSNGSVPDTYSVYVTAANGQVFQLQGNGAPTTFSLPVSGGTAPYTVDVGYVTSHGNVGAEAKTS